MIDRRTLHVLSGTFKNKSNDIVINDSHFFLLKSNVSEKIAISNLDLLSLAQSKRITNITSVVMPFKNEIPADNTRFDSLIRPAINSLMALNVCDNHNDSEVDIDFSVGKQNAAQINEILEKEYLNSFPRDYRIQNAKL